ncbi:SRPBCC family protein [Ilumatobacter nonamiensis]|uniref:SRPBCC family protein n=1 Tax=Ilumatobacter nonamiensis TaxID=467093 RepID=UPI00058FA1BE
MPVEVEVAFDLSLSIDLHVDSFAGSHEAAIGGTTKGQIELGEFVTWRARHFGRVWTMTSVITEWDRPHRFVDEQHKGPFKKFRHEHEFIPVPNGTQMIDYVEFTAPFGPLGWVAEHVVLDRYLRHLIGVRNTFLIDAATKAGAASSVRDDDE